VKPPYGIVSRILSDECEAIMKKTVQMTGMKQRYVHPDTYYNISKIEGMGDVGSQVFQLVLFMTNSEVSCKTSNNILPLRITPRVGNSSFFANIDSNILVDEPEFADISPKGIVCMANDTCNLMIGLKMWLSLDHDIKLTLIIAPREILALISDEIPLANVCSATSDIIQNSVGVFVMTPHVLFENCIFLTDIVFDRCVFVGWPSIQESYINMGGEIPKSKFNVGLCTSVVSYTQHSPFIPLLDIHPTPFSDPESLDCILRHHFFRIEEQTPSCIVKYEMIFAPPLDEIEKNTWSIKSRTHL
jgi:hypothetical protein